MSDTPLLEIKNLQVGFDTPAGLLMAVRGVDLEIFPGEIVALVGESGCGKSLTAMSILNLLEPPARTIAGEILYKNENTLSMNPERLMAFRGAEASLIFQEPMTALNPVFTIGDQICEVLITHGDYTKKTARNKAVNLLSMVGIPEPASRIDRYPFELSGGMRQRAMIAMALAMEPALLIADEPTTALDVTIQLQILELIKNLSKSKNMAVLLITHDIGIVSMVADKIAIMYAGEIMEYGDTEEVLKMRKHPYTQGLLNSLPTQFISGEKRKRLEPIPGAVPELKDIPEGCVFRNRCPYAEEECVNEISIQYINDHYYRCIL
jgi:oligopeptide transport system ATP-binding protein